ncbi:MAG: amino acid ABC transporter ATP-binding protein [Clostridiales Family XIII bacterium]|nr:amino acid ABC transporter ATP-binding protein [Clostridiales Family XIII bacterium]
MLDVENLYKSFGPTEVLKGISFSLERGKSLAVIGASGSGKTTLLRCLNFLEEPDGGTIRVKGEKIFDADDPSTLSESEIRKNRLHFGLVFQSFNLFPQYTALRNVTLAPELLMKAGAAGEAAGGKLRAESIDERARRILGSVGLSDRLHNYPHQLSGGQQQRVAIARALALEPDILCFDEPTSALDPELTGEVLRVIGELAQSHTTMIIVTHEMQFAREIADTVVFMDGGVIVEQGEPDEVLGSPREERTKQFLERYSQGFQ